jgi:hypothetical protein
MLHDRVERGWLMNDNRLSGGKLFEASTYTCPHCSVVVIINKERTRERAKCLGCRHDICDACGVIYSQTSTCVNIAARIERHREHVERQKQAGLPITPFVF